MSLEDDERYPSEAIARAQAERSEFRRANTKMPFRSANRRAAEIIRNNPAIKNRYKLAPWLERSVRKGPNEHNHVTVPKLKRAYYILLFQCARQGMTLKEISKLDGMPPEHLLRELLEVVPGLKHTFERSQLLKADFLFDQILEIADDSTNDFMKAKGGEVQYNPENVARSRLRIEARKFMIEKLNEGKYGDRSKQDRLAIDAKIQVTIETKYEEKSEALKGKVLEGEVVKTVEDLISGNKTPVRIGAKKANQVLSDDDG